MRKLSKLWISFSLSVWISYGSRKFMWGPPWEEVRGPNKMCLRDVFSYWTRVTVLVGVSGWALNPQRMLSRRPWQTWRQRKWWPVVTEAGGCAAAAASHTTPEADPTRLGGAMRSPSLETSERAWSSQRLHVELLAFRTKNEFLVFLRQPACGIVLLQYTWGLAPGHLFLPQVPNTQSLM